MENVIHILRQKNIYFNERYFLWSMGSIFLFGIVSGMVTLSIYRSLREEAGQMGKSDMVVLKQIKMKYEQFIIINGSVLNTYRMVERYIRNYKAWKVRISSWRKLINACELLLIMVSGVTGTILYAANHDKEKVMMIIVVGGFLAYALFMYERLIKIEDKEKDLVCYITDYLDNTLNTKAQRTVRTECTVRDIEKRMEEEKARIRENKRKQEKVLSDILDNYL
ncbi:MAG: hypothetical protein K6G88_12000 [Lachnospiraceae bacterium]|nr:hypothetical protein [Lachnospiraceae bacterium]